MDFYFSGIASRAEMEMLTEAGASGVLVDPSQVEHLDGFQGKAIRDSGAYAMHRASVPGYGERVAEFHRGVVKDMRKHDFERVIALDVFGDHERTRLNYVELSRRLARTSRVTIPYTPVWHWGAPADYLDEYLDHAEVIGIGGLVTLMREKDKRMLDGLVELCWQHPCRFHIFGCNWPKAITELRPYARSADSSLWLRYARYRLAVFQHTGHGGLTQAPAKFIDGYQDLDRRAGCVLNARNIEEFCNA